MSRKTWLTVAFVVLAACTAAVAFHVLQPSPEPHPPATAAAVATTAPPPVAVVAVPAGTTPSTTARPAADYNRYRAELERIRAARGKAGAVQANERCIQGQRYRKVGAEWERSGICPR